MHRLEADPSWPKVRLDHIESDEQRLIARLIANVCRRNVSAGEKSRMLEEPGELYVKMVLSLELSWPEKFLR